MILFNLIEIKIKINDKNKIKTSGKDYGSCTMLQTQDKHKMLNPFDKNCNFGHFWLLAILQKGSTSTMHNSFNFDPIDVFLDFLESLRCPLGNPFGLISIESSMFMYEALTKRGFCWLFKMTYNVQIYIFLWVHILNLGAEDEL